VLTPAQLEDRKNYLNASEVRPLVTMDAEALMRLWAIKTGRELPEDLSNVWAVGVGLDTEQRHLDRYERLNRVPVTRRGERVVHSMLEFAACTLDGWIEVPGCPLEVKHVGGREPYEVVVERYMPQLTWQMCCCNTRQAVLSIARCLDDPVAEFYQLDDKYGTELLRRGLQFWEHVKRDTPPMVLPPMPPPVDKWVDYNMAGNDTWRRFAAQWLQTRGAAESCKEAEKTLKSLVPEDARKCFADGVRITRSRAGLSLRVDA